MKIFFLLTFILSFNSYGAELCSDFLVSKKIVDSEETLFQYATTWSSSRKQINPESQHQVNGLLIEIVTEFFTTYKKLPSKEQIEAEIAKKFLGPRKGFIKDILSMGLAEYFKTDSAPKSVFEILQAANSARRKMFFPFKDELKNNIMFFLSRRLRPPTMLELSKLKNLDPEVIQLFIPDPKNLIDKALQLEPKVVEEIKDLILNAYFRALAQKDLPESKRTQISSPTYESIFIALTSSKIPLELKRDIADGRFNIKHLKALIEGFEASDFLNVSVFSGLKQVEQTARVLRPTAFKNFIPTEIYNSTNINALKTALTKKQGFLVTSVNAGIPINEAMFATMLKYAKDKDYDIIVFPTGGILDGIDTRLLENPNVHIVTHTIENQFLKIWNIPILPKNQNGLASLNNPKQHKPMQTILVGHPTIQHFNVPTATNDQRPTAIWSTGSLSQNNYPYRHAVQGRTSQLAKNQHTNGFLVLEKSDGESGFNAEGVSNFWHVRPVMFAEDVKTNNTSGFTDVGVKYYVRDSDRYSQVDVKKTKAAMSTLVLGDLHERIVDPVFLKTIIDFVKEHPELSQIVIHDPIDGGSHNHHESKSITLLKQKFINGELDYHKEMMGLVQVVNAITSIRRGLRIIVADSNHSYWGQKLLSGAGEFQEIANGSFLTELRNAQNIYRVTDPLRYVFEFRNDYISRLPEDAKNEILRRTVLVQNPEQVLVLPYGRNFVVGPNFRQTHINFHGHQGANGAKSSPKSHAIGSESSITGDSHQSYLLGNWMSVGTATPLKVGYNDGGYSAWSNSFAIVYEDGTKQLFTYSNEAKTFISRENKIAMTEEEFFGKHPLEIIANDNDVVQGTIVDQHTHVINALAKSGQKNNKGE